MSAFLRRIGLERLFRRLPNGLLVLLTVASSAALGLDLLIPDFLPFLDEALLALLAVGGTATVLERRTIRAEGGPLPQPPGQELARLDDRVLALIARASALRAGGHAAAGLDGLQALPEAVSELQADVKRADGFLSRRDNDPWLVGSKIEKAQRLAQRASGEEATRLEAHLAALRAHRIAIDGVVRERADALSALSSLAGQVDSLALDLENLEAHPDADAALTAKREDLHPHIARVVASLAEARLAEAELEEALDRGRGVRATDLH